MAGSILTETGRAHLLRTMRRQTPSSVHRRMNALLLLLDAGMSCEAIAKVLLLDDDTNRTWYRLYEEEGIEGLASFGYEGGACRLNEEQQEKMEA